MSMVKRIKEWIKLRAFTRNTSTGVYGGRERKSWGWFCSRACIAHPQQNCGQARDVGSYTLLSVGTRGQRESEVGL